MQAGFLLGQNQLSAADAQRALQEIVGNEPNQEPKKKSLSRLLREDLYDGLILLIPTNPRICELSMIAVAQHLPVLKKSPQQAKQIATAASSPTARSSNPKMEMQEIATKCAKLVRLASVHAKPRSAVAQTGVLHLLAQFLPSTSTSATNCNFPSLDAIQIDFLESCVHAEQYKFAARTVASSWPIPSVSNTVEQVLQYYFMRGLVNIGTEDWDAALRCFRTCLAVPGDSVSQVVVAAWKRLVLIQCIVRATEVSAHCLATPAGTPHVLTTYISDGSKSQKPMIQPMDTMMHVVENTPEDTMSTGFNPMALPRRNEKPMKRSDFYSGVGIYSSLCKSFEETNLPSFMQLVQEEGAFLQAESTGGLVARVIDALHERIVVKSSRMFAVLPLGMLSAKLGDMPEEQARSLLFRMSVSKGWQIEFNNGNMVCFPPFPLQKVGIDAKQLTELSTAVQKLDCGLACSPKYQRSLRKEKIGAGGGPHGVTDL